MNERQKYAYNLHKEKKPCKKCGKVFSGVGLYCSNLCHENFFVKPEN